MLLRDYQMHPWKQIVLHVDFQRVDETTRLHKKVPLHFVNEENSPAVKTDKCLVNHVATELEIECLASQLPEFITIDLGDLVKGQSLHVNDLKLPDGIKVVHARHAEPGDRVGQPAANRGRSRRPRCGGGSGRRADQGQEDREAEQEIDQAEPLYASECLAYEGHRPKVKDAAASFPVWHL